MLVAHAVILTPPDLGGENAPVEQKDSIAGIIKVITSATAGDSGKYLRYNGEAIPW